MVLFEYPLHERTRLFLRLEQVFHRLQALIEINNPVAHQSAMQVLFELLDIVSGRGDLKSELSQELDKQRNNLQQYLNAPGVDPRVLDAALEELNTAYRGIVDWQQRPGQHLRENEWMNAVKARSTVPGGMCEFDLPNYHRWLSEPDHVRRHDLDTWVAPFLPILTGLKLTLKLLRQSGEPFDTIVNKGQLQIDTRAKTYNLMRIWLSPAEAAVPEISASKFVVWIRLMAQSTQLKSSPLDRDVPLRVALCCL